MIITRCMLYKLQGTKCIVYFAIQLVSSWFCKWVCNFIEDCYFEYKPLVKQKPDMCRLQVLLIMYTRTERAYVVMCITCQVQFYSLQPIKIVKTEISENTKCLDSNSILQQTVVSDEAIAGVVMLLKYKNSYNSELCSN